MINVFSDSSLRGPSVIYESNCSRGKGNYSGFSNLLDMRFELALTLILCCAVLSHSVVSDSLQLHWTVAHQAPLSMDSPGKNTGMGCHALLQGTFLTQGLNMCLLHCRQMLYCLSHWGSTKKRREAKGKGVKERYTHLKAEFQRIARRAKKDFLSD